MTRFLLVLSLSALLCLKLSQCIKLQQLPPSYIINLESRNDRKALLLQRLAQHNIKNFQFIEAVDAKKDEKLISFYWHNDTRSQSINASPSAKACFLSHIRALRQFLLSSSTQGLIMEDDALFRKDFVAFVSAIAAKHTNVPLILLSAYVSDYTGSFTVGSFSNLVENEITTFSDQIHKANNLFILQTMN